MKLDWLEGLINNIRKHRVEADAIDTVVHQGDQTKPAVMPEDTAIFSDEQMLKLSAYKEEAASCQTYEDFIKLIEKVVNELGLNLLKDSSRVAAVLNTFRETPL